MALTPVELFTKQYMDALTETSIKADQEIKDAYTNAAKKLAILYLGLPKSHAEKFRLTKASEVVFKELREALYIINTKYAYQAAKLSKTKNTLILNQKISADFIEDFLTRKIADKTLKQRLLKYSNMFKMEIEGRLAIGIADSETQSSFIRAINKFIEDPYSNLIVDTKSNWAARRIAVKYNSGTGTYKSSFANMKRLIRSESYEVFRRVDYLIWSKSEKVMGVLVYLNPAHPAVDSCDYLIGTYPKGFVFTGFHVACICLARPILKGDLITSVPRGAKDYMSQDKTQKWWGKLPIITENKQYWR